MSEGERRGFKREEDLKWKWRRRDGKEGRQDEKKFVGGGKVPDLVLVLESVGHQQKIIYYQKQATR